MIGATLVLFGVGAFGTVIGRGHCLRAQDRLGEFYPPPAPAQHGWLPPFVSAALQAADVSAGHAHRALVGMRVGIALSIALGFVFGAAFAIFSTALVVGTPAVVVLAYRKRREQRLVAALPDALELIARSLRSGSSLAQALAEVASSMTGPLTIALARIVDDTEQGASLGRALQRFAERSSLSEIRVAVAALTLASESGASPSRALDGVGTSLRDSYQLRSELAALTSQARASALVLIALPIVFVLVNAAIDPSALEFLLSNGIGRVCLLLGSGLDAVGWIWMRRLVQQVQA